MVVAFQLLAHYVCSFQQLASALPPCSRYWQLSAQAWASGSKCKARWNLQIEGFESQGEKPPKIRKKAPRNKVPGNFWPSSH